MGRKELAQQGPLVKNALATADDAVKRYVLGATIEDNLAFCWAALRQFERRDEVTQLGSRNEFGLHHGDFHLLLIIAHETVSHVEWVERILDLIGEPQSLPPDQLLRDRLREARNLLAEHRDERVVYRRLTLKHTPHVVETYRELGVPLPAGSIDSENLSTGMVGGLLSLPDLEAAVHRLSDDLEALSSTYRGQGSPPS